MTGIYEVGQN